MFDGLLTWGASLPQNQSNDRNAKDHDPRKLAACYFFLKNNVEARKENTSST